jgi:hypothetical protein
MLRAAAWEAFECLFILAVLIGAVAGVAFYTTAWLMLLPVRLALPPRGHGGEVQPLQDRGASARPCSLPAIRGLSKAA